MTKILVVDDEAKIRQFIRKYAEYEGFLVSEAEDGLIAVELCTHEDFDLVVMDVMMPNLDGFHAVEKIHEVKPALPCVMLSALGEEYDKVHGFDIGVDDYVVKPFSPKELMMRIKAILRRTQATNEPKEQIVKDGLVIDLSARIVTVDGERISLAPKEYDLLVYLAKNMGIALTREQILDTVWGYDYDGDRTLDTHVKMLRKNLGEYAKYIVTLRGVGYRFEKEA